MDDSDWGRSLWDTVCTLPERCVFLLWCLKVSKIFETSTEDRDQHGIIMTQEPTDRNCRLWVNACESMSVVRDLDSTRYHKYAGRLYSPKLDLRSPGVLT